MRKLIRKIPSVFAITLIVLGGFFVFQIQDAKAAVDPYINFQGKMVSNTDGTNVSNASHTFLFCLYTTASPATACTSGANNSAIWRESKSITTVDGIFQTNLGDATGLPAAATFNTTGLYLGINFDNNGQMTPLVEFTSAPYAFNAEKLQGADWASPSAIGTTTAATGTFTNLSTTTGGLSIADGQAYGGAGAVTLSSTTNGLTLNSGNNTLTIDSSDTALVASGVATLTLAANASITNASGNLSFQPAGTGTANVQIGDGGATSATPDLLVLDIGSAEPTGSVGAMYYSTALSKFRCYQGAAWADCIGTGGSQTPWAQDISAATYDLTGLSNLLFGGTTGAPTGTDIGFFSDNTGDLNANVLTGKTLNLQVNGTDEYNFSSSALGMNSNNITGLGTNLTAAAGLTVATTTTGVLTLDSGTTGAVNIGTGTSGKAIHIGDNDTTADTITIGSAKDSLTLRGTTITIGNIADTTVSIVDNNWSVTNAGVASFITGSVIGSQTFTTNNIADSGALTIASGTASGLTLNSGTIGAISIGTDASAETISIGTGAADKDLTIGSTTTGSTTKIQSGSASGITIEANGTATGNVQIGDGGTTSATPDLLVMDIGSAEPAGTVGATYYSTALNKFRCYEGAAWKDCDTTGGGGVSDGDKGDITVSGTGATWNVDFTSTDGAGATSNASGMETGTGGIGLLQGCSDGQILKWTESTSTWACAADTAGSGATTKYLTANHGNSTVTGTKVTSLDTTLAAGTYVFEYSLMVQSSLTTTSPMFGVNFTGTAATRKMRLQYSDNSSTLLAAIGTADDVGSTALGFGMSQSVTAFSTTTPNMGHTGGVATANANIFETIQGIIIVTASGDLDLWHGSETANATTIMAGSSLVVQPISAGADLAEIYGTMDASIEAGDVVSLDLGLKAGVKKSTNPYDRNVIGIIATQPNLVMGSVEDEGATPVMVAMAGRVPVKVTTENGPIKAGDLLTSSSTPGVAMRATKAGQIIGQAMIRFDGEGVGLILAFVKTDYATGSKIADLLPGLSQEENSVSPNDVGKMALVQFISQKEQLAQQADMSEIVTDRLAAGLEIITPKITAETAALDKIEAATGLDISLNLADGGSFKINNAVTGETGIIFDGAGNATFQGTVTADSIVANKILGLDIFTNQVSGIDENVSTLSEKLNDLTAAIQKPINLSTLGILEKKGGLSIAKETTFKEATVFEKLVTFVGNVVFRGEVSFEKSPVFSKDTAGYAVIREGQNRVQIAFDKAYKQTPIINASLSLLQIKDDEARKDAEKVLLSGDVRFIITNATEAGFEIRIDRKADSDTPFSWNAIAVKDPRTFSQSALAQSLPEVSSAKPVDTDSATETDDMPATDITVDPIIDGSAVVVSDVDVENQATTDSGTGNEIMAVDGVPAN